MTARLTASVDFTEPPLWDNATVFNATAAALADPDRADFRPSDICAGLVAHHAQGYDLCPRGVQTRSLPGVISTISGVSTARVGAMSPRGADGLGRLRECGSGLKTGTPDFEYAMTITL